MEKKKTMIEQLRTELLKQAQYQDLDVSDLKLETWDKNGVIGTCKINGKKAWLPKILISDEMECLVTGFLANFPNAAFNPVHKFRRIAEGVCPDCDDKLSDSGCCIDCHIIPALDPDFQAWLNPSA